MKEHSRVQTQEYEIANIWEVLGRRWSLLVLKNLCDRDVIRFNELKRALPGIRQAIRART